MHSLSFLSLGLKVAAASISFALEPISRLFSVIVKILKNISLTTIYQLTLGIATLQVLSMQILVSIDFCLKYS